MTTDTLSILITDDDRGFRETLSGVLQPQGFRTLLAGDGEEALEIVRHEPVHLLLMDMHMPKLTGLETFQRVRQIRGRLPCILMSANADQALLEQARAAQIFWVLAKPVSRLRITTTVQMAIRANYRQAESEGGAADLPSRPSGDRTSPGAL
jgi:CheY-like chemotaxis protein